MSASSSVGQRFSQLIQALGMSKNAFAISLDKTATVIQHLVDERNKPGFDLMNKVVDVYPNVSIEWLLRGKGPMLLNEVPAAAAITTTTEAPVAAVPATPSIPQTAAAVSKVASVTPAFPTPLFAVSAARPSATAAPTSPAEIPLATAAVAPPEAASAEEPTIATGNASAPAGASAQPEPVPAAPATQLPPAAAPAALDAATLTAALHAQHLQHQLALAEQRNQHLLEQQKLILERQALMQQMLDLMRRPI
jgi:hypothetical protein